MRQQIRKHEPVAKNRTFTVAEAARAFRQVRGTAPKCAIFDGSENASAAGENSTGRRKPATGGKP